MIVLLCFNAAFSVVFEWYECFEKEVYRGESYSFTLCEISRCSKV